MRNLVKAYPKAIRGRLQLPVGVEVGFKPNQWRGLTTSWKPPRTEKCKLYQHWHNEGLHLPSWSAWSQEAATQQKELIKSCEEHMHLMSLWLQEDGTWTQDCYYVLEVRPLLHRGWLIFIRMPRDQKTRTAHGGSWATAPIKSAVKAMATAETFTFIPKLCSLNYDRQPKHAYSANLIYLILEFVSACQAKPTGYM